MNTRDPRGLPFHIAGKKYLPGNALIIAELGTSHGADRNKARELIDAAAGAGADCIKFQIVYADEILHPNTGEVALPGGKIRLYDRFRELELPPGFFLEMKEYTEKKGLLFLCTPFGIRSAGELKALNPQLIKIASPELNYTRLLAETSSFGLPVILSSGVSKLGDIEYALGFFGKADTCLLHCITAYPAPEREYNLRVLRSLRGILGIPVGLSDHSLDPVLVPSLAVLMGASVIEKHFCLSRKDPGLDDPIALDPQDFRKMVRSVRRSAEREPGESLAEITDTYGKEYVDAVLGDGIKRLAPSEAANYERTNRSIHALCDIKKGDIIRKDMIAVLRTEKKLKPGLHPSWEDAITGKIALNDIPAGEGITFADI